MFFILFSIEFVANHALLVALNLSQITHFWCKLLGPKKAAGVNVLPYSSSARILVLVMFDPSTGYVGSLYVLVILLHGNKTENKEDKSCCKLSPTKSGLFSKCNVSSREKDIEVNV